MAEVLVTSDTAMFCGTDGGPAVKHNVWMCVVCLGLKQTMN